MAPAFGLGGRVSASRSHRREWIGFKTVRTHPRYPRLRLELRTALSWKSDVEYALEKLLGSMSPEALLRPVRPATRSML